MKNVSNYYDKVPIWNGGVAGGEGVGGYFEQHLAALMTLLQLWVGGTNKKNVVSYGDDDILFQYFTFKLLIFALDKSSSLLFSQPCSGM